MSSKDENIIAKNQNQKIEYRVVNNTWLDSVVKEKSFKAIDITDNGIVTAKIGVKLPKSSEEITVVVWKEDYIGHRLTPWTDFQHKNIMPLLSLERISSLNAVLIYSIPPDSTLQQKVNNKEFRSAENSLEKVVLYMAEATHGIKYLHEKGYAHLNIKPNSIAVLKDGTIKIDQFHFLSPVNASSARNGLPQSFNPPETFYDKEMGHEYPQKFDSWSVGIMMIELFTGGYLSKKLPKHVDSWCTQVYPILFKVLQKKKFSKQVHKNFPGTSHRIDLKYIRYLIAKILALHPKDRPTVADIHEKFCNWNMQKSEINEAGCTMKPKIWKRKMYWIELMRETARVMMEAREWNEKSMESSAKEIVDKTESHNAKTVTRCEEYLIEDPYRALRDEILDCFGGRNPKATAHEDTDCSKIYELCETNLKKSTDKEVKTEEESAGYTILNETNNKDGTYIHDNIRENIECSKIYERSETEKKNVKDKEFKTEEECDDFTTLNEENNNSKNACHGNIFSKLFRFGNSALKYLSDPWSPENPSTYMNKLSKNLTR